MQAPNSCPPRSARHLLTLGALPSGLLDPVLEAWHPDVVGGMLEAGQTALLVYEVEHADAAEFVSTLERADTLDVPVGIWPIYTREDCPADLPHTLGRDEVRIDWSLCRFRLFSSPLAGDPDAPWQLRRSEANDDASLHDDLTQAGLLVLQGHSGPMDGYFGPTLTLCGRALHRPGLPGLFPCLDNGACFRQPSQGRPESSTHGLVDPRGIHAPLVVLDGCGTLPVPGSIYPYAQSLLRGLISGGRQGPMVASLGISATPMSGFVLLLALLAKGLPLGRAVREVNLHRSACDSPSSFTAPGVGPWVVVGNPEVRVQGLHLDKPTLLGGSGSAPRVRVPLSAESTLLELPGVDTTPVDLVCSPKRWAWGATDRSGIRYVWLGPASRANDDREATASSVGDDDAGELILIPRDTQATRRWRERAHWLREGNRWIGGLQGALKARGDPAQPLSELVAWRTELAQLADQIACAATPQRALEIAPALDALAASLVTAMESADRAAATTIADYVTQVGARLSHLWSPPWLHVGTRDSGQTCTCGCRVAVHLRRHPLVDLIRGELSCPACSLIGDAAALAGGALVAQASLAPRTLAGGANLHWTLDRSEGRAAPQGFSCASLFEPFKRRRLVGAPQALSAGESTNLTQAVPEDWPGGMSWATLVLCANGAISMFAYDVHVKARAASVARVSGP